MLSSILHRIDCLLQSKITFSYSSIAWKPDEKAQVIIKNDIQVVNKMIYSAIEHIYYTLGCTGTPGPNLTNGKLIIQAFIFALINETIYPDSEEERKRIGTFFEYRTCETIAIFCRNQFESLNAKLKEQIIKTLTELRNFDQYAENENWFLYLVAQKLSTNINGLSVSAINKYINSLEIERPS